MKKNLRIVAVSAGIICAVATVILFKNLIFFIFMVK